jgi:NAD-dependent dihydropyrimidine dehydrogenase PreA subunit
MPLIDPEKCDGCGLCLDVCSCGGFVLTGDVISIKETVNCDWCTLCEAICPTGAITCSFEILIQER